jgi:dihydrofolate reductase
MGRLVVFCNLSLDGYYSGRNGDISWFRAGTDAEYDAFISEHITSDGPLILGRVTYEMMASYWPTPEAFARLPVVAEQMNKRPKIVFSRTIREPSWQNTRIIRDDLRAVLRELKTELALDVTILGSGNIVAQLAGEGVIDEYQIVINPVAIGVGRTLFGGLAHQICLTLISTRTFGNGRVYARYKPSAV